MASPVRAGGAFVELSLKADEFNKSLTLAERKLSTMARSVNSAANRLIGLGVAGAASFVPLIKAASDLQETMSKFDTVFGDQSDAVKQFSDDLARSLGRGQRQIADFLASSQDLFVPLGFDSATATDLSKTLTRLAIDLASFNNLADSDALRDLQAAITGSGEVMKKYGVILTEAAVKQELFNQGIDPKLADNQQKALARLNIILAGTTAAQGDAERTSGSFANQLKRIQGLLSDTAAVLGGQLLPQLTQLAQNLSAGIARFSEFAKSNGDLVVGLGATAAALIGTGAALKVVAVGVSALSTAVGALSAVIGAVSAALAALGAPVAIVAAAVAGLIIYFSGLGDAVANVASTALATFLRAMGAIANALLAGDIQKAGEVAFAGLVVVAKRAFAEIAEVLGNMIKKFFSAFDDFFGLDLTKPIRDGIQALNEELDLSANAAEVKFNRIAEAASKAGEAAKQAGEASSQGYEQQTIGTDSVDDGTRAIQEQRQQVEDLQRAARSVYDETRTDAEKYRAELDKVYDLQEQGLITFDTVKRKVKQLQDQYAEATGETQRHEEATRAAQQVYADTRTESERYAEETGRLADLLREGYINHDTFNRAVEAARDNFENNNADLREAQALFDSTRTASEKFATQLDRYAELRQEGFIDEETFQRAKEQLEQRLGLDDAANGSADVTRRLPTQGAVIGGQRAGQIFGSVDTVAKQALQVQKQQLEENRRIRQAVEKGGLVFAP